MRTGCCSPRLDLFLDNDLRTIHYPLRNSLMDTYPKSVLYFQDVTGENRGWDAEWDV